MFTRKLKSKTRRSLMIGAALATVVAVPVAYAVGEGHIDGDTMGFMLGTNGGQYYMGRLKSTVQGELMRNARELSGGVAVFRSGGKFYIAEDPKGTFYRMQMDRAGGH